MHFWESRVANVKGEVPLWINADILHRCLMQSEDLKADMTVHRREHRGNVAEHNAEVRYKYMIKVLMDAIATEREAMNQEKQRSAEQRLVGQYTKSTSSNQPAAPGPTAKAPTDKPHGKPKVKPSAGDSKPSRGGFGG